MVKRIEKQVKRSKRRQKYNIIEDKSLKKFILQHSKRQKIDFTKFKISSFIECLNSDEEEEIIYDKENNLNKESKICTLQKGVEPSTFGFSFLKTAYTPNEFKYKSSIFL